MISNRTFIGIELTASGFVILWLISQNLVLAAISTAFLAYIYIGYLITSGKDELKMETFCHFSIRFAIAIIIVSILETLLRISGVHSGPISLAFSWPLLTMGIILFVLSSLGEIGIILVKWERLTMEIEEGL